MEKKKRQHYVPRFYLNRFLSRNDVIAVFDKKRGVSFTTSVENVALEKYFYDFNSTIDNEELQFLENNLAEMEADYANLLEEILRSIKNTRRFDKESQPLFSLYLVIQFLRTREYREKEAQLRAAMIETINQKLMPDGYTFKFGYDDEAKMHFISMFDPEKIFAMIEQLLNKTWIVWKNKTTQPFYTSDHPACVISEFTNAAGFATPGAEILLPLSSNYLLDICDHNHFQDRKRFDCKALNLRDADQVDYYNSAQVDWSTRQIYCATNDFSLAKKLIQKNPALRNPNRKRVIIDQLNENLTRFSNK